MNNGDYYNCKISYITAERVGGGRRACLMASLLAFAHQESGFLPSSNQRTTMIITTMKRAFNIEELVGG